MHQSQVVVWAIVREFAKHAFDKQAFVTGGYPRDLHYGRHATDVDITIPLGDYDAAQAYAAAEGLCAALAGVGTRVEVSQAYDQASGDFNERIHILIQVHCQDGQEVDIMFHKAPDLEGVFATYDSNINQVWLKDGVPAWHAGHPPVECVGLKELTADRILRIHNIASQLGLPIVAESFTAKPDRVKHEDEYEDDFPF